MKKIGTLEVSKKNLHSIAVFPTLYLYKTEERVFVNNHYKLTVSNEQKRYVSVSD